VNGDLTYQPDEPAIPPDVAPSVQCTAGDKKPGIALEIPRTGRLPTRGPVDITRLQARSPAEQLTVSLGQLTAVGEIASLTDARFSRDNAAEGLWRPFDFLAEAKLGLYFLEPYSPTKTPVLFVHGINATPMDFTFLIDHLDRNAFQPWVYYYPSGAHLDNVGDHLNQTVQKLQARYDFHELVVVAHSMGGLVARSFILKHAGTARDRRIPLFVSIASPWNGHTGAAFGAKHAPAPVRAWVDLVPGSDFLTRLFYEEGTPPEKRRRLPASTAYHLIFAFLPTESGDGTISLVSQLRREAQEDAVRLYGLEQSHTGVLADPDASRLLNRLLGGTRR
jgi:pimeloyl-ACP methyl ester carboxylesterase